MALTVAAMLPLAGGPLAAADLPSAYAVKAPAIPSLYDWTGWYAGGHVGYAAGHSDFTATSAAPVSGTLDLFRSLDSFAEGGSFFEGLQVGYNTMLPNRVVLGVEADASFPAWSDLSGLSIGGASNLNLPVLGAATFSETVLASGSLRGRVGYAPGDVLFYATGGFAWSYNRQSLALADGTSESPLLWRLGWAAGAGVEAPIAPHWTAKAEYLFTGYPTQGGLSRVRPAFQFRFRGAGTASRPELSLRCRCTGAVRRGRDVHARRGPRQPARPGDFRRAGLSVVPLAL